MARHFPEPKSVDIRSSVAAAARHSEGLCQAAMNFKPVLGKSRRRTPHRMAGWSCRRSGILPSRESRHKPSRPAATTSCTSRHSVSLWQNRNTSVRLNPTCYTNNTLGCLGEPYSLVEEDCSTRLRRDRHLRRNSHCRHLTALAYSQLPCGRACILALP
jgi:hypothetical protein